MTHLWITAILAVGLILAAAELMRVCEAVRNLERQLDAAQTAIATMSRRVSEFEEKFRKSEERSKIMCKTLQESVASLETFTDGLDERVEKNTLRIADDEREFEAFREEQKELAEALEKAQKHEEAFYEGFSNIINYTVDVALGKGGDDGR